MSWLKILSFSLFQAIAIFAIMAIVAARPTEDEPIPIVRQSSDILPDGSFTHSYETGNGISVSESGHIESVGEDQALVVEGSYGYTSPEGQPIELKYVADENGYRPISDSLPSNT